MRNHSQALVIDDEPQIRKLLSEVLEQEGWKVAEAGSAKLAIEKLGDAKWSLVFCDVVLGGPDGYSVLREFSEIQPTAVFVLMTGHGSAAGAFEATSKGAYEYLVKPFTVEQVREISEKAKEQIRRRKKNLASGHTQSPKLYGSDLPIIGSAPKFVECLKLVGRVSATDLPVLIGGESGTGKEVVAKAIHERSSRSDGPFIAVNCGAIPTELIESELFGHVKGSFSGAVQDRVGLWEEADGGTLFLDEITETSPLFQTKLLRALQEGEVRRIGSNHTIRVDVRVIASTNQDIDKEVNEGRFRQDLMYRLNAVTICLPQLKDRKEDIPQLMEHFTNRIKTVEGSEKTIAPSTMDMLIAYDWPGNVRELENAALHAASLSGGTIYPEHLPERIRQCAAASGPEQPLPVTDGELLPLKRVQERYVKHVLEQTDGNKQAAARILEIDRKTLTRIVERAEE